MACIEINRIIGILSALRENNLCLEIVPVKAEKFSQLQRVPDLFKRKDIGIK